MPAYPDETEDGRAHDCDGLPLDVDSWVTVGPFLHDEEGLRGLGHTQEMLRMIGRRAQISYLYFLETGSSRSPIGFWTAHLRDCGTWSWRVRWFRASMGLQGLVYRYRAPRS